MATPDVIDFERLLAPISEEAPAGTDIREDYSPQSPYFAIKDAGAQARTSERKRRESFDEVPDTGFHLEDWDLVLEQGEEILSSQSKDLEVAAWFLEGLLRERGFAGIRDGFRLIRELVERFWDDLFPLPDEDGMVTRVAPITSLNGEDGPGTLIWPISNIPITANQPWSSWQYRQAQSLDGAEEEVVSRSVQEGAITLQMFDEAINSTSVDFYRDLVQDMSQVLEELQQLTALLDERCGLDESGYPVAPSFGAIEDAIREVQQVIHKAASGMDLEPEPTLEPESAAEGDDAAGDPGSGAQATVAAPATDGVMSREQAFRSIQQLADYFKKAEPHSPTAYLLEKAVRLGKMPFPRLMRELVMDEPALSELFRVTGIGESQDEQDPYDQQ